MSWVGAVLIALTGACSGPGSPAPTGSSSLAPSTAVPVDCVTASAGADSSGAADSTSAGLDVAALTAGVDNLLQVFASKDAMRAVLVSVDGRTVVERYPGSTADESRDIYSVTKSVMSTLIGIAIADHRLAGLDQTLDQLLPDYASTMSPEVAGITLRQILTMTAGLPADSDPAFEPTSDWIKAILTQGNDQQPGQFFEYSNAAAHLLSAILEKATGQSTLEYARRKLFDPVGIATEPATTTVKGPGNQDAYHPAPGFAWPTDPQGHNVGYVGIKLAPRDLVTLGRLYLDRGQWNGAQVVPADWVDQATCAQVQTSGLMPGGGYGYMWWTMEAAGDPAYVAAGYGGQLIMVVPARRLVIAVSSDTDFEGQDRLIDDQAVINLLSLDVLPAVPRR